MPRVSEKYRARQSLAITVAARRCFARTGFHATTMDEIVAETGMSPATVYRYFPSKTAIVEAVCTQKTAEIAAHIDEMADGDSMPTPGEVFSVSVRALTHPTAPSAGDGRSSDDEAQVAYLALNIWTELRLNPELRAKAAPAYVHAQDAIKRMAARWCQSGILRVGLDPDVVSVVVWKYALGFITNEVVSDDTNLDKAAEVLDALLLAP